MSSSYYDDDILFRILALDALEQQNSKMQVELSSKKIVASTSSSSSFASATKNTRKASASNEQKTSVSNKASASNEQKASASLVGLGGTNLSDVGGTSFPIRPYQRQPTDVYPRKNLIHTDPETGQTTHEEAMLLPVNVQVQFYMTNPFAQNVNGTRPNPQSLYGYRMNEIKPVDLPDIETGRVRSTLVLEQSFQPYSDENPRAACPWAAGITALPTGYNSYRLHNSRGQLKEYRFYPKSSKSVNDRGYVFHFLPTSLQRSSDTNILDCGCFFLGVEEVRSPSKGLSTEANSSEFAPTFRDLPWFLLPELTIDTASGEPKLLDSEPATEDRVFNEDELYVLTRAYLLEEMCERRKYPFDTIMSAATTYAGFRRTTNTEGEELFYRHQHMSMMFDQATGFTVGTMCFFHKHPMGVILGKKSVDETKTDPPLSRFISDPLLNITTNDNGDGTSTKSAHRDDAKIQNLIQTYQRIKQALQLDQELEMDQTQFPYTQLILELIERKDEILLNNRFTARMNQQQLSQLFVNNFVETHLFEWDDFWKKAYRKCPTKTADLLSQQKDTKSASANKMKVPYSVSQETWEEIASVERETNKSIVLANNRRRPSKLKSGPMQIQTANAVIQPASAAIQPASAAIQPASAATLRKGRPVPLNRRLEPEAESTVDEVAMSQLSSFRPPIPITDRDEPITGKKRKKAAPAC